MYTVSFVSPLPSLQLSPSSSSLSTSLPPFPTFTPPFSLSLSLSSLFLYPSPFFSSVYLFLYRYFSASTLPPTSFPSFSHLLSVYNFFPVSLKPSNSCTVSSFPHLCTHRRIHIQSSTHEKNKHIAHDRKKTGDVYIVKQVYEDVRMRFNICEPVRVCVDVKIMWLVLGYRYQSAYSEKMSLRVYKDGGIARTMTTVRKYSWHV